MGSLRSPVGPLPSSIYWRRRAVLLLLLVVLVLLVSWAVRSCGAGDEQRTGNENDDGNAQGPAESITPGPASSSGSLIDERPGGREESESGDSGGGETGGDAGDDAAAGETEGYDYGGYGDDGGSGETTGTDGEDGGAGDSGDGEDVSGLPACTTGDVTLSLRADENEYARGEEPDLRVTVANDSDASCRVDFGHDALTVTIADAEDERVWSSDDCPTGAASIPTAVPAGGSASHTIHWDRRHSTPDCEDSPGEPAASGTYVAEAHPGSLPTARTSFRLDQD